CISACVRRIASQWQPVAVCVRCPPCRYVSIAEIRNDAANRNVNRWRRRGSVIVAIAVWLACYLINAGLDLINRQYAHVLIDESAHVGQPHDISALERYALVRVLPREGGSGRQPAQTLRCLARRLGIAIHAGERCDRRCLVFRETIYRHAVLRPRADCRVSVGVGEAYYARRISQTLAVDAESIALHLVLGYLCC